jgi:uncharacterized protein (DUF302 family)
MNRLTLPALALFIVTLVGCAGTQPVEVDFLTMSLVTVESDADVETTFARLRQAVGSNPDLTLFAEFDHAANAESAGLSLRPTRVLVFGNPNAGTPLMQAAPTLAIDLPQKMLVYEGADGRAVVAYNSPYYLAQRHGLDGQRDRLDAINGLLSTLARTAAGR